MLFIIATATAIPAKRGAVKVTQPDGSTITVSQFGDEYFHWIETTDGYNVVMHEDGFFYYDAPNVPAKIRANDPAKRGAADRSVLSQTYRGRPARASGISLMKRARSQGDEADAATVARMKAQAAGSKFKSLVVLVNFTDLKFSVPSSNTSFTNLLNQDGYSANGATGSAWNYFYDNSNGKFDADFDVLGPIELSKNYSYYGGESTQALYDLMRETVAGVSGMVNWADYSDGKTIRPIFIFFAGYNEAENTSRPALIWPHQIVPGQISVTTSDGYTLHSYACASEYSGSYGGGRMAGIGTFCHEFGHVIGLPDFYDTDQASRGSTNTLGEFSFMDYGPYNNNGRTPPAMTAEERNILGWLTYETLNLADNYTLPHISSDKAYKIITDKEGEYFSLETRGSTNKWDRYVFNGTWGGMLVMHVDKSGQYAAFWEINDVNDVANHPCYLHVRASRASTNPSTGWLFPGTSNTTELSSASNSGFKPWSGVNLASTLSNISYSDGTVSFSYRADASSITISPALIGVNVGETAMLTIAASPVDARPIITWSSSNPAVASVDENGVVTGVSGGQAVITATTSNNKTATSKVRVLGEITITSSVLQNDALLSWDYEGEETFLVELSKNGEEPITFTTTDNYVYIQGLTVFTNYVAMIYLIYVIKMK